MAVGMAMAEAHLAAKYNRPGYPVMDHYTYSIVGDGDLMEGISHEAASLAGHLKLGKLIVLYDSNGISLDGPTTAAFTENVGERFKAYGWEHIKVEDGNDLAAIDAALTLAKKNTSQPTLIEVKTTIGFGAENQGTNAVHGNPLGADGVAYAKKAYGWDYPAFTVPAEVATRFHQLIQDEGAAAEEQWQDLFAKYQQEYPELAQEFTAGFANDLKLDFQAVLPHYEADSSIATRNASQKAINALTPVLPTLWGGAADLASSNKTMINGEADFQPGSYAGRNLWFGVREFAMAAALNGISLHGGTRVYGGTFFVFSDYLKAAIRLSALQHQPVIYVLTHDSVAVGEDGPTHEPIEQLAGLRAIPDVQVLRPADGNETSAAWATALQTTDKPTLLVLSRQNLATLPVDQATVFAGVDKGGYVVAPATKAVPDGILTATGSEVNLALAAQSELRDHGQDVSVVSLPSWERFAQQDPAYQEAVLPAAVTKRVTIEAAATFGWAKFAGSHGASIGIDHFGASAPGDLVLDQLGMNVANVVDTFMNL